eukprot:TRINITY_DN1712_c0_g3_i9.p1 TRINITY_DN1712_c0_g3~~TRINITY_DN1712_c0_g3_i9.p1  ORF type:complete len:779 (+),score=102.62 TRINITY_DN1712_c0_g3_i9:332-2668(+)
MRTDTQRTEEVVIRTEELSERSPPVDCQILSERFQNYTWSPLPVAEVENSVSSFVQVLDIRVSGGERYLLKRIRMCPLSDDELCYRLKTTLNKEMEGLKTIGRSVHKFVAEVVDHRYYKSNQDSYSCVDVLFKIPNADFLVFEESMRREPKVEPVNEIMTFLGRLEEVNMPYGLLLGYNNIIMEDNKRIMVVGLGLIEAAISHKVERNAAIKKENIMKIVKYARMVNGMAITDPNVSTVRELKASWKKFNFTGNEQWARNAANDLEQSEHRFSPISKESLSQNWMYRTGSSEGGCCKNCGRKMCIFLLVLLTLLSLGWAGYLWYKYKNLKDDYDSLKGSCYVYHCEQCDQVMYLAWEKSELYSSLERAVSKLGEDLPTRPGVYDTSSAMEFLRNLLYLSEKFLGFWQKANSRDPTVSLVCEPKDSMESYRIYNLDGGKDFYRTEEGYIIAGTSLTDNGNEFGTALLRTNFVGEVIGTQWLYNEFRRRINKMIKSSNGEIVLAGLYTSQQNGRDALWIAKFDPQGNEMWSYEGTNSQFGVQGLVEDEDGGIIAVGAEYLDETWSSTLWAAKIMDSIMQWKIEFTDYTQSSDSIGLKAIVKNSQRNNYLAVGHTGYIPLIMTITGTGAILNTRHYFDDGWIYFHDIIEIEDGFVILATNSNQKRYQTSWMRLYKVDYDGNDIWKRDEQGIDSWSNYIPHAIVAIPNGFAMGGRRCYHNSEVYPLSCSNWIMGFDLTGEKKWQKKFSGGAITKMSYEDGKLVILEDIYNAVAMATFDIPTT